MLREEGRAAMLQVIRNVVGSMGLTAEKAMDLLMIPQVQRAAFYMRLHENA